MADRNLVEFIENLTKEEMEKLTLLLDIPEEIANKLNKSSCHFLIDIENWQGFNAELFLQALKSINPLYYSKARLIPKYQCNYQKREINIMGRFVRLLREDITENDWKIILNLDTLNEKFDYAKVFKICLRRQVITKDLDDFVTNIKIIKKDYLVPMLDEFSQEFTNMSEIAFYKSLKAELENQSNVSEWENSLQDYMQKEYSRVQNILSGEIDLLKNIYIPLTIIEQKPDAVSLEDDNTENELDFLEKFYSSKHLGIDNKSELSVSGPKQEIGKMNIVELMNHSNLIEIAVKEKKNRDYDKRQDVSWIIIGNPGSGKTFLCSRIALLYGMNELSKFKYCLTIPCRNIFWRDMEDSRVRAQECVTEEFIRNWLMLGMPDSGTAKIKEDFAKAIIDTDGESLLLIIDSMDEFTKDVPVEETFLSDLLQRRYLTKSTMILTSRPGAWTDISSRIPKIQMDFYFQVLGFSPKNRDKYFEKKFKEDKGEKLNACKKLLSCHHEIHLLSLIPVNSLLFANLFQEDDATSYTLTQLYSSLILNLIRRQLQRMRYTVRKVKKLEQLDEVVLDCLYEIGEIAYEGVGDRKLTSTKVFKITLGKKEYDSECLGLVNVSMKKDSTGVKKKVWTFSHLTLQEFVAAYSLSKKRFEIYQITEYLVVKETFTIFKMVLRFLCGLLKDKAQPIIKSIYKHQLVTPLSYSEIPFFHQNRYESKYEDSLFSCSGCQQFSNQFIAMSPFLVETNINLEKNNNLEIPSNVSLYIQSKIAPNEWNSFKNSLLFLNQIHLLYIDSNFLSTEDFDSLLGKLEKCKVDLGFLTLKFTQKQYSQIEDYFESILKWNTSAKINFNIDECSLNNIKFVQDIANISGNHQISCMNLSYNTIPTQIFHQLITQVNSLTNLYFRSIDNTNEFPIILPQILKFTNLQGLHLFGIPDDELLTLQSNVSFLSNLKEISLYQTKAYSILPELLPLSELRYLDISGYSEQEKNFSQNLFKLLDKNTSSLRTLVLYKVESIGVTNLSPIFKALHRLTALVRVKLEYCQISFFMSELGDFKIKMPRSLICLELWRITLTDEGLLTLFEMLYSHEKLRYLMIAYCSLTSKSCRSIASLIYTLRGLKRLVVCRAELSKPSDYAYKTMLMRTANLLSIDLKSSE